MAFGYGDMFGKIFDWLPGRKEHFKNKIDSIKREMDELTKKAPSAVNTNKYESLARELRELEAKIKNAA